MVDPLRLRSYISYNPVVRLLPEEDVMQELMIVAYLHHEHDFTTARRAAVNAIYRLAANYGYSRKKGKDNFSSFYEEKLSLTTEEYDIIDHVEKLYLVENLTAREIALIYNVEFNNKFAKILCKLFPKNMGLGGKRKNSGRKKK